MLVALAQARLVYPSTLGLSQAIVTAITTLLIYLSVVFAAVLFAPSPAKEFETKAVRFFTHCISRNQWLASRLIPGLIGAVIASIVG